MKEVKEIERGSMELIEEEDHRPVTLLAVEVVGSIGGSAIILDGSTNVDPYYMVKECKKRGYDEKSVLRHILVSRAFTAYQFKDLVTKARVKLREKEDINFLGIVSMSPLFEEDELGDIEGKWIRSMLIKRIKKSVERNDLFAAIADPNADIFRKRSLQEKKGYLPNKSSRDPVIEEKII